MIVSEVCSVKPFC